MRKTVNVLLMLVMLLGVFPLNVLANEGPEQTALALSLSRRLFQQTG